MTRLLRFSLLTILLSTFISAAAFTVDGINYKVISNVNKTVEVTSGNYSGDIVIPEKVNDSGIEYTVTKIGNSAFYYCYTIKSISLPNTITEIGESAFEYCVYLTSLTLPETLTTIGNGAFGYCNSITSLKIPKNVTSIATYITYGAKSLQEIVVADENPNYSSLDGGLYSKDKTKLYAYPNMRYPNVVLPEGVTTIMDGAFWDCADIKTISVPESVNILNPFCFYGCGSLTSINLPSSITTIPQGAFYYCTSLTSVVVPESVTSIGQTAFANCDSLLSVKLGNAVKTIGMSAFMNSGKLNDLTLPASLKSLGMSSLRGTAIKSITIPKGCTSIGDYAFMGCNSLKEILVESGNVKYSSVDGMLCNRQGWEIISWPGGKATEYTIPQGITNIKQDAFSYCEHLEKIELINDVTTIGSYAFSDNANLKTVILGEKVTSIKEGVFSYCSSLNEIYCKNAVPVTITSDVFKKVPTTCTIYVPIGAKSTYQSTDIWKNFRIEEISSSVEDEFIQSIDVRGVDGGILISGADNMDKFIYSINGELVYKGMDTYIKIFTKGVYIVKVGSKIVKVILK